MKRSTKLWIALGLAFGILQTLFLVGKEVWFKPYHIGSGAMEPTLLKDDRVFVLRTKDIARGDLTVYHVSDENAALVKRTIALGGDTFEMRDKQVVVNGKKLVEPYVKNDPDQPGHDFGPMTVPDGHVFVLGDNRDSSNDSRYHGAVPMEQVVGRVIYTFSPSRMMQ